MCTECRILAGEGFKCIASYCPIRTHNYAVDMDIAVKSVCASLKTRVSDVKRKTNRP